MNFRLQKITVTNFKAIQETLTLDFTNLLPGLYFIRGQNEFKPRSGSNGVSKSSLFVDSVYWALTGTTSNSKRPSDSVVNWENKSDETKVSIYFSLDGSFFSVVRSRNPNNLELNGLKVEQEEIDNLLPLTDAALRRSIFIDQFGDKFLSIRPEEKSKIFSDTLNLDLWTKAAEKAGREVSTLEKELAKEENKLSGTKGSLKEIRDQLDLAIDKEAEFETTKTIEIDKKKKECITAKKDSDKAKDVLNDARAKSFDLSIKGNDNDKCNNLKTLLRQRQNSITQYKTEAGSEETIYNQLVIKCQSYEKAKSICPECGNTVSEEHIKEKLEEAEKLKAESRQRHIELTKSAENAGISVKALEKEIAELEECLVEYNKHLNEVSLAAEKSLAADRYLSTAQEELETVQNRVNPFTDQCDKLEHRLNSLVKEKKDIEEILNDYNAVLEIYRFWQKGFKEIRLEQIDSCLLELEMSANQHIEALGLEDWEIEFTTERETKKGSISHGFSVFIYPPGQSNPILFESYSGGEAQRLQLAATFGLAEVLLTRAGIVPDFEVLDEPTVHLSPEGVDDLLVCLRERALELNRRIFVIDHHALDRGAFDAIITVRRTKDGIILDDNGLLETAEKAVSSNKRERVSL